MIKDLDNVGMQISAQFIDCTYFVVDIFIVNFSKWTDQLSRKELTVSFKNKSYKADGTVTSACPEFQYLASFAVVHLGSQSRLYVDILYEPRHNHLFPVVLRGIHPHVQFHVLSNAW